MRIIDRIVLITVSGILLATFAAYQRVFLNIFTDSLPQGIYVRGSGELQRGQYATTCLTREIADYGRAQGFLARGFCKTGIIPVGKVIKGIPGDQYSLHNNMLLVNGERFDIAKADLRGRELRRFIPDGDYVLKTGEYILISNFVSNSWDSRYWGPVTVEYSIKPLVVFHGK